MKHPSSISSFIKLNRTSGLKTRTITLNERPTEGRQNLRHLKGGLLIGVTHQRIALTENYVKHTYVMQ